MNPEITVVVPYHNEKETIEFTLGRVAEQTLPPSCAIFVNSSSTDDSSRVVDDWIRNNQPRLPTRFVNLFEGTDTPASSKNAGIRRATTEWVAFMDCGQRFEKTWLERQFRFAVEKNLDVVSGVVHPVGENWVDRCAVAQTYGYRRNRPCVPTTLARKSVFARTGLFLDGRRAGYDVAWILKLRTAGIERGVNDAVKISYIGPNIAATLADLYRKSALYAKPSVGIGGYYMPYAYAVLSLLPLILAFVSPVLLLGAGAAYFVVRSYLVPVLKSRSLLFVREHPAAALLGTGIVGATIDLGKISGTWQGMFHYFVRKPRRDRP